MAHPQFARQDAVVVHAGPTSPPRRSLQEIILNLLDRALLHSCTWDQRHRNNSLSPSLRYTSNFLGRQLWVSFTQDRRHRLDCFSPKLRYIPNFLSDLPAAGQDATLLHGGLLHGLRHGHVDLLPCTPHQRGRHLADSRPEGRQLRSNFLLRSCHWRRHASIVIPMPEEAPTSAVPWALRGMPTQKNRVNTS